jgi:Rieske Fe-S protein
MMEGLMTGEHRIPPEEPRQENLEKNKVSRRDFMGFATWAIGGLIGVGMVVPSIIYVIGPALQKIKTQEWIRLGSISKIEPGIPTLFKFKLKRQSGWIK